MKLKLKGLSTLNMSHEEWLKERKKGIGGSDIGSIMGVNTYNTSFDVWLNKTGRFEEDLSSKEVIKWGNILEDVVAKEFAAVTEKKVARCNFMIKRSILIANIDRRVIGESAILEVKTTSLRNAYKWGPSGSQKIPKSYFYQIQHYLYCTGYKKAYVAVLIGGQEMRIYEFGRDEELMAEMEIASSDFWWNVVTDTPPQATEVAQVAKAADSFSDVSEKDSDEIIAKINSLKEIEKEMKAKKKEVEALKAYVASKIGVKDALVLRGKTLATWKTQESCRLNGAALKKDMPELVEKYQKKSVSRVLRIK